METKIEAEPENETVVDKKLESDPEKETVVDKKLESKPETNTEKENTITVISEPVSETTLQRLTPALIVSVSILFASVILSATSYAKSRNMTPEVRNFYYQLPPPGPYMSNLAMPQPPRQVNGANNTGPNFRAPQMNRPSWARPIPPWVNGGQAGPGTAPVQKNKLTKDQKSTRRNQPPQMNRPSWAQPTPPWMQRGVNKPQRGGATNARMQQNNQNLPMHNQPQAMVPPPWVNQPPQMMNRPNWARPTPPPWVNGGQQNAPTQQNNLSDDQKAAMRNQHPAMVPPPWVNQPPQMYRPNWARPTPPWMRGGVQGNGQNTDLNTSDQEAVKK